MRILLIRHAKTKGNLEGRYIGRRTDEGLCDEGIRELQMSGVKSLCSSDMGVYTGCMRRCVETARLLFSDNDCIVVDELSEIDFGDFENKNYKELNGNADYQSWIDSGGKADYPNGEKQVDFIKRSMDCFLWIVGDMQKRECLNSVIVCHGGNIMAIMSVLTGKDYFDFQVSNAKGIEIEIEVEKDNVDIVSYHFV